MVDDHSDRAYCRAINLNSAAFQLSLPSCSCDQNQEYIAIIIPQSTGYSSQFAPTKSTERVISNPDERCRDFACQYEPNTCVDDRWKTEYRSTIDECGKRLLCHDLKCKRDPIYPRNNLRDDDYKLTPLIPNVPKNVDVPIFNGQYDPVKKDCQKTAINDVQLNPRARPSAIASNGRRYIQCENPTGRRPMCRCRVRSEQKITYAPAVTTSPPRTRRPLPRC